MQSVVTKSAASPRKIRKTTSNRKMGWGSTMLSTPLHTRRRRTNMNQFANWTNIAAGIHSTTASESRLFPRLTNSWLMTTDQFSGYYMVAVWSTACTVQKARYNSGGHKIGIHLLSGVLSD